MPNWSYNVLTVHGEREALRELKHAVWELEPEAGEKRAPLDFERHLPMPPELAEDEGDIENGVFPEWREWRCEHWGTKWNACYATLSGTLTSGVLRYRFHTAWTPTVAWLDFVAEAHPELRFELSYVEEMGHFRGSMTYEHGERVVDRAVSRMSWTPPRTASSQRAPELTLTGAPARAPRADPAKRSVACRASRCRAL